jgi:PhzF family phenazine biosynthesis protein
MTARPVFQVDAFTGEAFRGNPAAVVVLDEPAGDAWLQAVAREMNLSETAFLRAAGTATYDLRWFTPTVEVDLCGHATLASAHVLWTEGYVDRGTAIRFTTRGGTLAATRRGDDVELDFPANTATERPAPGGFFAALGLDSGRFAATADGWYLVELPDAASVRGLDPDFRALAAFPACIVTAPGDGTPSDAAIVSRVFGPSVGIDEDPVTGSAHCVLATWWAERLGPAFRAEQASPRGGALEVRLSGDRVQLTGRAVTVLRGTLVA